MGQKSSLIRALGNNRNRKLETIWKSLKMGPRIKKSKLVYFYLFMFYIFNEVCFVIWSQQLFLKKFNLIYSIY